MIRFTKAKPPPKKPKKQPGGKKATLNKLKSFLTAAEPETVEILVSNWNAQQNSVTYKELREAYLAGGLTEKQFQKWQKDYSKLVTSTLAPKWQAAADAAAQEVKAQYPYFVYEPSVSASMDFIKQHRREESAGSRSAVRRKAAPLPGAVHRSDRTGIRLQRRSVWSDKGRTGAGLHRGLHEGLADRLR